MSTSDDDWETADLMPTKRTNPAHTAAAAAAAAGTGTGTGLRPGAASFQPSATTGDPVLKGGNGAVRAAGAGAGAGAGAEAGPSRPPVPSALASRPPVATTGEEMGMDKLSIRDERDQAGDRAVSTGPKLLMRNSNNANNNANNVNNNDNNNHSGAASKSVWSAPTSTPAPSGRRGPSSSAHFPQLGAPVSAGQGHGENEQNAREEAEDEWFTAGRPVTNRQIWENANASARPMALATPNVLPAPGIKILRRSAASPSDGGNGRSKGAGAGTQTPPKTIEEREEEYRLARERIFGSAGAAGASAGPSGATVSATANGGSASAASGSAEGAKGKRGISRSTRSSPAPSPPLGPTPTQVGASGSGSAHGNGSGQGGLSSASATSSSTFGDRNGNGRSKSGGGERRRGPATSGGAPAVLSPSGTAGSGTYSPRGAYGGAAPSPSASSPYGHGSGASAGAGAGYRHDGSYAYGYGHGHGHSRPEDGTARGVPPGLLRQPRGPGDGAGFGAGASAGSGLGAGQNNLSEGAQTYQQPQPQPQQPYTQGPAVYATDQAYGSVYGHPGFEGYGSYAPAPSGSDRR